MEQRQTMETRLKAQEKTIRVLAERLEQQTADNVSGFALFEQNVALEHVVATRTEELEKALSELKATQAELLQAQKMRAIGELAAGIAHEINTPTQYVGNNLTFLKESFVELLGAMQLCRALVSEDEEALSTKDFRQKFKDVVEMADLEFLTEEVPDALAACEDGIGRISTIVGAMKTFAHSSGGMPQPVDVRSLVDSTVEISRNEWKFVAALEVELDPEMETIVGMRDELGQALLNLIVNAAHAIEDRDFGDEEKGLIRIITKRNGSWGEFRVEDNGCGIPAALQQKIFEPFFTTKEVGRGSGQGLAIVYSVVSDKHQGEVKVESEPGKGSIIILRLPLRHAAETTS